MASTRKTKRLIAPPLVILALKDKLQLFGIPLAIFGFIGIVLHLGSMRQQNLALTRTLQRWQTEYHLDVSQVESIRTIELDFHGSGSPFSSSPTHTPEETRQHYVRISHVMKQEDATRFLEAMLKKSTH